jgi:hypothetical protein
LRRTCSTRTCKSRQALGLTPLESQQRLTQLAQHATHENKTKNTLLYAKGHSAQPDMFCLEDTSHQIRPKIDAGDAALLLGSIN